MKRSFLLSGIAGLALLSACTPAVPPEDSAATESSSPAVQPRMAMAEGTIQKEGVSITMQGTHRLLTDTNEELLLKSSTVDLDSYLDERVRVSGDVTATVEAGGVIMEVESIERVTPGDLPVVLEEGSSSEAASSQAASLPSPTSSSAKPSVSSAARSSIRPAMSSVTAASSVVVQPQESSSVMGTTADTNVSVKAMAKAQVDSSNFNQTYCSSHIGFCIPYHRNWYYQSFGANVSPYLWHVEVADHAVENQGDGAIVINLVSGSFEGQESTAVEQGDFVVASRQWTGNRHFEVSGPAELRAAVEFMARGIEVQAAE